MRCGQAADGSVLHENATGLQPFRAPVRASPSLDSFFFQQCLLTFLRSHFSNTTFISLLCCALHSLIYNNGSLISYIKGTFVTTGVKPAGSTWARNPIPRSATDNGGMSPENW